jgi:hypothetical protein
MNADRDLKQRGAGAKADEPDDTTAAAGQDPTDLIPHAVAGREPGRDR